MTDGGTAEGQAMSGAGEAGRDGTGAPGTAGDPTSRGHHVRDREVVLLAAFCVAVVLGLQFLGIIFPPLDEALGRPPTMIVALVVVTLVVLGRALWASMRHG
jgi:hypothetical protein